MANADDLKMLAQEVADAYEERVNTINAIKAETAGLLHDFDKAHEEMTHNLRQELAKVKPELEAAEDQRKAADQAEIKEREVYIENLLDDFDKAHQEMADDMRAELAKVKPELEADEAARKKADQAEIKEREVYIENLLNDFDEAHQEMANNMRRELAKVKPELEAAEGQRRKADQAEIKEREVYIENLLNDFDEAHQEMANNMRRELAKVKPELEAAEGQRRKADQAEVEERRTDVRNMLDEFRKEQEATAAAWRGLLAGMASVRGKVTITGAAGVAAAIEAKPVEEAFEEAFEEEGLEEREELQDNILDLLDDNPDGLRMVEIADALDIPSWRSLIPVMRELLDEGEVTKEDSTYYIA